VRSVAIARAFSRSINRSLMVGGLVTIVLRQYIAWLERGSTDLSELKAAAVALPAGSEARRASAVTLALAEARLRLMGADPAWTAPLEAVRTDLGRAPWRATLADTWRPVAIGYAVIGLAVALAAQLLRAML